MKRNTHLSSLDIPEFTTHKKRMIMQTLKINKKKIYTVIIFSEGNWRNVILCVWEGGGGGGMGAADFFSFEIKKLWRN